MSSRSQNADIAASILKQKLTTTARTTATAKHSTATGPAGNLRSKTRAPTTNGATPRERRW